METLGVLGYIVGGISVAVSSALIAQMVYKAIKSPSSAVPYKPGRKPGNEPAP